MSPLLSSVLCVAVLAPLAAVADPPCRDRFAWPFATRSVWNMPLGSGASFVAANIFALPLAEGCSLLSGAAASRREHCAPVGATEAACVAAGCCWAPVDGALSCFKPAGGAPASIHNDQDIAVLATVNDPLVPWIDQGNWGPGDKCTVTGSVAAHIPMPHDFAIGCTLNNNAMVRPLLQPAHPCMPHSPAQSRWRCQSGFRLTRAPPPHPHAGPAAARQPHAPPDAARLPRCSRCAVPRSLPQGLPRSFSVAG